jgi:4-amino-4-deoxy-L-arabinose transferase-like glycosyltransferase
LFTLIFGGYERLMSLVCFFFIPLVFWTSGIRKDGLIFLFMSLIFYHFYKALQVRRWWNIIIIAISLFMLFLIRSFLALTLLPALLAWGISEKINHRPWKTFSLVYSLSIILFFASGFGGPVDFPRKISERQQEFFRLKGGSVVRLDTLTNDPVSYLKILPQALNHVFLRPYPGEQSSMLFRFAAWETWFIIAIFALAVIYPSPSRGAVLRNPFVASILFYGISNYLLIGYTIPFLGAIVRYRNIFETLFLTVLARCTEWKAIPLIKTYIKNI